MQDWGQWFFASIPVNSTGQSCWCGVFKSLVTFTLKAVCTSATITKQFVFHLTCCYLKNNFGWFFFIFSDFNFKFSLSLKNLVACFFLIYLKICIVYLLLQFFWIQHNEIAYMTILQIKLFYTIFQKIFIQIYSTPTF